MPLYDVEHVVPLTDAQCQALAHAYSSLHASRFNTPAIFINTRFTDVFNQRVYRGSKPAVYNRVILRTRASESRTREEYGEHCRDISKLWDEIMCPGEAVPQNSIKRLRTVWVMGALTTGVELGIQRPAVGQEDEWLVSNRAAFARLAAEGDEDMQALVDSFEA